MRHAAHAPTSAPASGRRAVPRADPFSAGTIVRHVVERFRRGALTYVLAYLGAEVLASAAMAPILALLVRWVVGRTGRIAATNEELVPLALSAPGLLSLVLAGTIIILASSVAAGSVMVATQSSQRSTRSALRRAIGATLTILRRAPALVSLAARQIAALAMRALPFAAVIGLTAWMTLRGVDLNWLVTTKPARLWWGVAIAAPVSLLGAYVLVRKLLLWSVALPACVLERSTPSEALRTSEQRLDGRLMLVGGLRIGWWGTVALLTAGSLTAVHWTGMQVVAVGALGALGAASLRAMAWTVAGVLVVETGIVALAALVHGAGDALLRRELWAISAGANAGDSPPLADASVARIRRIPRSLPWLVALIGVAACAWAASIGVVESMDRPPNLEITAHRGASSVAPENTLAAFRAAAELDADRIELDVMRTSDGAVVVVHDTDLRRLANDPRRVRELSLAELKSVDIGAWWPAVGAFPNERIPTLEDVLELLGGESVRHVPLNIELKPSGDERELAEAVASILRRTSTTDAVVTSLSLPALTHFRRAAPEVPLGAIVTTKVGDLFALDVEFLSISSDLATPALLRDAKARKLPVLVWTVNDGELYARLALSGAAGVITDDVEAMRAKRDELASLSDSELLLLAYRLRALHR